jgi:hypothetical protein
MLDPGFWPICSKRVIMFARRQRSWLLFPNRFIAIRTVRPSKVGTVMRTHANAGNQLELIEIEDMVTGDYSDAFKGMSSFSNRLYSPMFNHSNFL